MDVLRPFAEKRSEQLTLRMPKSAMSQLRGLIRIWTAIERWRTGDKEAEVSLTEGALRVLETGLAANWAQLGIEEIPKSEEKLDEILTRALETAKVKVGKDH